MKSSLLVLCLALTLASCNRQPKEPPITLRIPITFKEGYGPFYPGFSNLDKGDRNDPAWRKTFYTVSGIPRWSSLMKTRILLDFQQFTYQQVRAGNLDQSVYDQYSKAPDWRWRSDTAYLSAKPIKCYVNVVRGFNDRTERWAILVDTNNNLDFSDETPIYPNVIQTNRIPDKINDQRIIRYEVYQNGRIKSAYAPIMFSYYGGTFLYNFPRHGKALAELDGKAQELLIDPDLSSLAFGEPTIALSSSVRSNGRIDKQKLVEVGDEIDLFGVKYRNNGISPIDNMLELEPVNAVSAQTNPLQNGRVFQPFTGTEFVSGKPIDLQKQRGKYVFIDFWHTGCKGCVEDMPNLNAIYARVDKRKVAFVGINCGDTPERLRTFLQKKQVKWPQILSNNKNDYYKTYRVSGFPTSVLLDPQGKIIARDLHSHALDDKLAALFHE